MTNRVLIKKSNSHKEIEYKYELLVHILNLPSPTLLTFEFSNLSRISKLIWNLKSSSTIQILINITNVFGNYKPSSSSTFLMFEFSNLRRISKLCKHIKSSTAIHVFKDNSTFRQHYKPSSKFQTFIVVDNSNFRHCRQFKLRCHRQYRLR